MAQDPPPTASKAKASSRRPTSASAASNATRRNNSSMGNRKHRSHSVPSTTAAFRLTSVLLLLGCPPLASPSSSSTRPYPYPPEHEEYDPVIFDPHTLFGAPLGGYARTTRSRLAKLPLRFVGGAGYNLGGGATHGGGGSDASAGGEEDEEETPEAPEEGLLKGRHHFAMRDGDGRKFACAVYDEDELDPSSVRESMFDPPRPRTSKLGGPTSDGPEEEEEAAAADLQVTEGTTQEVSPPVTEEIPNEQLQQQRQPQREQLQQQRQPQRRQQQQQQGRRGGGTDGESADAGKQTNAPNPMSPWTVNDPIKIHANDIKRQLSKLTGTCAQLHDGWWSYEWCAEGRITQFHVAIDQKDLDEAIAAGRYDPNTGKGEGPKFAVESVTSIGTFEERHVLVDDGHGHRHHGKNEAPGELSGAIEVRETYEDGDICDVTGEPRRAEVHIRCCPESKAKSSAADDAESSSSGGGELPATLLKVTEHAVCDYRLSVCTPLLCHKAFREMSFEHNVANRGNAGATPDAADGGGAENDGEGPEAVDPAALIGEVLHFNLDGDGGFEVPPEVIDKVNAIVAAKVGDVVDMFAAATGKHKKRQPPKKPKRVEGESVRDILDRTLGNVCLQRDQGWWVYEFCHGRHAREFHPATVMDRVTGLTKQAVEEEHKLGLYDSDALEGYPDHDEWKYVVNATDSSDSPLDGMQSGGRKGLSIPGKGVGGTHVHGGNGAVFEQEYVGGDVCDHSDVTDSAIKGGTVDGGKDSKGIERSTTVRFSCGKSFEFVKMNEDSTCHYEFEITVPDLCHHPLFKAEVVKTQVVKCLPV